MSTASDTEDGFDMAAAGTRSLLGWGVVAGAFYLVVGLAQAFVRDGFDLARHQLSLLMLGDFGWIQTGNLILSGLMVIAAAVGFARALRGTRAGRWAAALLGVYGVCMIASGIVPPDPVAGLPEGSTSTEATLSGLLHLAFGAIGFVGGAVLATQVLGVILLWTAVVAGFAWLAAASLRLYRTVPHPDAARREQAAHAT